MRPSPGGLSAVRVLAICFSAATLIFARQIAAWTDLQNRFLYHWQRIDAIALAVVVIVVTAIGACLVQAAIAHGGPRSHRSLRWVLVLILTEVGLGYLVGIPSEPGWWLEWALPASVLSMVVAGLVFAERILFRAAATVSLVLSPLGLITLSHLMSVPAVDTRVVVNSSDQPPLKRPPIVMVIFDDWSRLRSTSGDTFHESLPNLRSLAASAFDFVNAESPDDNTLTSIPQVISQSWTPLASPRSPWWLRDGPRALAAPEPKLFTQAASAGYESRLIGFYLPYRELVGETVREVETEPHTPNGATFTQKVGLVLLRGVESLGDPASRWIGQLIFSRVYNRHWYDLNERIRTRVLEAIAELRPGTLLLAHFPLPHSPFVFSEDGSYQGDSVRSRMEASPEKYSVHLRNVDRIVGQIVAALNARSALNGTLLIVTSDHSWTMEPDQQLIGRRRTHVPLIIRWPGQRAGVVVKTRICLVGLQRLLNEVETALASPPPSRSTLDKIAEASCIRPALPVGPP